MHTSPSFDVSVVIPLLDEEESLRELTSGIEKALEGLSIEIIFVDDGSQDGSWAVIDQLHEAQPEVIRGIRFARNYGKSAALQKGFEAAQGAVRRVRLRRQRRAREQGEHDGGGWAVALRCATR